MTQQIKILRISAPLAVFISLFPALARAATWVACARKLVINLTGLTQVDSSGFATLVCIFVSMRLAGGEMRLVIPPGRASQVFDVLQPIGVMSGLPEERAALASLQ